MYEQHFGLEKRPFGPSAAGADVFVGPQTARTVAGFRKAVASRDAVITVAGHAGTGKTTLVHRAVDALGIRYKTVRVGRMKIDSSEVLESLLIVLGVRDRPTGTMRRLAALRKTLREHEERNVRIFIVIEDAARTGSDALAEIEALTSSGAGESAGATIILMGDESLAEFMKDPQLTRLQQRVRQRHSILPLSVAELRGYLVHSFRRAGGNFEQIFDARSAALLHALSGGIPRLTNNLVEATLATAADQGLKTIPATFVAKVALDDFALSVDNFDFTLPEVDSVPVATAASAELASAAESDAVAATAQDPAPVLAEQSSDDDVATDAADDDVPQLIQDTLPEIRALSPKICAAEDFDALDLREIATAESMADNNTASSARTTEPQSEADPDFPASAGPESRKEDVDERCFEPKLEQVDGPAEPKVEQSATEIIPTLSGAPAPHTENIPILTNETAIEPADILADLTESWPESDDFPEPRPTRAEKPEPATEIVPELRLDDDDVPTMVPVPELRLDDDDVPTMVPVPELRLDDDDAPTMVPVRDAFPDLEAEEPCVASLPEWDCEPTYAEFQPDLDALDRAMAMAKGGPLDAPGVSHIDTYTIEDINAGRDFSDSYVSGKKDAMAFLEPSIKSTDAAAHTSREPAVELDRVAAEIGTTHSLNEVDDKLAETLFGTEFSFVSEQALGTLPENDKALEELRRLREQEATRPAVIPVAQEVSVRTSASANDSVSAEHAGRSQAAVRPLRTDQHSSLNERPEAASKRSATKAEADSMPKSIEDQMNISMTRTLDALKDPLDGLDSEADKTTKTGFFKRFRRQ